MNYRPPPVPVFTEPETVLYLVFGMLLNAVQLAAAFGLGYYVRGLL